MYRISMLYIQYILCFLCGVPVYHMCIFQQKENKKQEKKWHLLPVLAVRFCNVINSSLVFADVS